MAIHVDDDQHGSKVRGHIYKGQAPLRQVPGYKATSSIPAKFETVLFMGARERKGFLSEAKRFNSAEHTEQPGPGAYERGLRMERGPESTSKKGFGMMVSSARRFKDRTFYTGPGPGEYKSRQQQALVASLSVSQAPASSAFMKKTTVPRKPVSEEAAPGPGAYSSECLTRTGKTLDYLSKPGATSAFKAGPHQLIMSGNLDAPPPTAYTMGDPWVNGSSTASGSRSPSRGGTSSFGAGSSRGGANIGSMVTDMNKLIFGDHAPFSVPDTGPGPGQYELQDYASIKRSIAKGAARASPPFAAVDYIDRFGRPQAASMSYADSIRAVPDSFVPAMVKSPLRHQQQHAGVTHGSGGADISSSQPHVVLAPSQTTHSMKEQLMHAQRVMRGSHPQPGNASCSQPQSCHGQTRSQQAIPGAGGRTSPKDVQHPDALGPHHAAPAKLLASPPKGVGAAFKSLSAGHAEYVEQRSYERSSNAPGPAYYNAKVEPKKSRSFHLNARKQFTS